jgi:hypothetical protein
MKTGVMPRVESGGHLRGVNYTQIDAEGDGELAGRLMRGSSIPQLIVFSQSADGRWHREQLVGPASEEAVAAAIARALDRSEARLVSSPIRGY